MNDLYTPVFEGGGNNDDNRPEKSTPEKMERCKYCGNLYYESDAAARVNGHCKKKPIVTDVKGM